MCRSLAAGGGAMDDTVPPSFMCPISHDVMRDPYALSPARDCHRHVPATLRSIFTRLLSLSGLVLSANRVPLLSARFDKGAAGSTATTAAALCGLTHPIVCARAYAAA